MSSASRALEAEKAAIVYQAALTKLGASVIAEALLIWQRDIPPTGGVSAAGYWMRAMTKLILGKRREARALARSYYRLERALRTGYTVADPTDTRSSIDLNELRSEFRDLAGPEAPGFSADTQSIPVEPLADLDADADRLDREAQREIAIAVGNLGVKNLEKKLEEIDTKDTAEAVDAERQKAHDEAGARQAAAAERVTLNGARSEVWQIKQKDPRAIGYVRLSRTGTPCGFCAMLISRGPVYKSERSATESIYGDGDLYHDNCHCYAVPVWSREQFQTSDLYALNREYGELWPKVTEGLGGKAALNAWRRFITTQNKKRQAQVASP